MKKLFVLFCVGVLLAGCSEKKEETTENEAKRETKVCTTEMAELNMSIDMEVSGSEDLMDKMIVSVSMPSEGVEIDDAQKEQIKKSVLDQYGIKEGEGVDVDIEVNKDNIKVSMGFDLATITDDTKEAFNITSDEQKISDFVEGMELMGATCK